MKFLGHFRFIIFKNTTFERMIRYLAIGVIIFITWYCTPPHTVSMFNNAVELGEALFKDPILSRDSSLSCASCHKPDFAFADTSALSKGHKGQRGLRNTPSAMNITDHNFYFWDGRAATLEEQALGPIENPAEMNLPLSLAIRRLKRHALYAKSFYAIYGVAPSALNLSQALADYQRSLETSDTPFDRYMQNQDSSEFSLSARRGLQIFNTKGKCFDCHFGSDFTGNDQFKNIGLYDGKSWNDKGRFEITHNPKDLGAFKTPGLRNIALTAPYMHNGAFKTLIDVIEYYNTPDKFVSASIGRDALLQQPLGLSAQEKSDLLAFLISLTDRRFTQKKI